MSSGWVSESKETKETAERESLAALQGAQCDYDAAPPAARDAAKQRLLAALREFRDLVFPGE